MLRLAYAFARKRKKSVFRFFRARGREAGECVGSDYASANLIGKAFERRSGRGATFPFRFSEASKSRRHVVAPWRAADEGTGPLKSMKRKKATLITSNEALVRRANLSSVVSGDTALMCDVVIALLAHAETAKKPKRKPTQYQKFIGKQLKLGLSISDAAKQWNDRKK